MPADRLDRMRQKAAERILADERLRSHLNDEEAHWLIDWAMLQLEVPLPEPQGQHKTEALIEAQGRRIRQVVRDINDLVGERGRLSQVEREARLRTLLSRAGESSALWSSSAEWQEALAILAAWDHLTNLELIQRLAALVERTWRQAIRDRGGVGKRSSGLRSCLVGFFIAAFFLFILASVLFGLRLFFQHFPPVAIASPSPTSSVNLSTSQAAAWYAIHFTSPQYPDEPRYHQGGVDERLIDFISSVQRSIDIAVYDFDLINVAEALIAARDRGVTVRLVTDSDNAGERAVSLLRQSGIAVVEDDRGDLMHNKFAVADGRFVWTGSWNFTEKDTYNYNNNAVLIESVDLARNYETVFEEMFTHKRFGRGRPPTLRTRFLIRGVMVESYFSPEDQVSSKIIARLREAQRQIDFMVFSFTRDDIGQALLERAQAGVVVRGVFESTGSETRFSEFGRLQQAGLDVRQDGNPFLMHHKVIIIDERTVIFGSYNFSLNAEEDNDENLLIVDDPAFAAPFLTEFERIFTQAEP
jgi:phosphatidylserine/phosphatidylglycerophosphate/cardiolipin synthase-like enzyme